MAEVTYKRRCFLTLRNVVLKNLRPASNAPHQSWRNDVFVEYQVPPLYAQRRLCVVDLTQYCLCVCVLCLSMSA